MTQSTHVFSTIEVPGDSLAHHRATISVIKSQLEFKTNERALILEYHAQGEKGPYTAKHMSKLDAEIVGLEKLLSFRETCYLEDKAIHHEQLSTVPKYKIFQKPWAYFQDKMVHRYDDDTPETIRIRTIVASIQLVVFAAGSAMVLFVLGTAIILAIASSI